MTDCTASMTFSLWFRDSTSEWIGEFHYDYLGTSGIARTTGKTKEEARNAAFATIGYRLMRCVWGEEELND